MAQQIRMSTFDTTFKLPDGLGIERVNGRSVLGKVVLVFEDQRGFVETPVLFFTYYGSINVMSSDVLTTR